MEQDAHRRRGDEAQERACVRGVRDPRCREIDYVSGRRFASSAQPARRDLGRKTGPGREGLVRFCPILCPRPRTTKSRVSALRGPERWAGHRWEGGREEGRMGRWMGGWMDVVRLSPTGLFRNICGAACVCVFVRRHMVDLWGW